MEQPTSRCCHFTVAGNFQRTAKTFFGSNSHTADHKLCHLLCSHIGLNRLNIVELNYRDLRIVFSLVRIESRIESAVYTTQAVTQPDGLQAYRTGL